MDYFIYLFFCKDCCHVCRSVCLLSEFGFRARTAKGHRVNHMQSNKFQQRAVGLVVVTQRKTGLGKCLMILLTVPEENWSCIYICIIFLIFNYKWISLVACCLATAAFLFISSWPVATLATLRPNSGTNWRPPSLTRIWDKRWAEVLNFGQYYKSSDVSQQRGTRTEIFSVYSVFDIQSVRDDNTNKPYRQFPPQRKQIR